MRKNILLPLTIMAASGVDAQQAWTLDKAHTDVMFSVTHLVIAEVTGSFRAYDGKITASKADFSDATVEFTIDVNSINTNNEMRDNHLKSDDFFNAGKFPEIKFRGRGMKKTGDRTYLLPGELTIRDITKPIQLEVVYAGTVTDPYGNTKAGFKVKGSIDRFDYNLKWNNITEAGGAVVGKEVRLMVNLELAKDVKQPQ